MTTALISFFIVLFAGLFFSEIFNRFHLPWVIALILAGMVIGPFGLGVLELDSPIEFIAEIGLVFLMFMAGLQARLSSFQGLRKEIFLTSIFSAGIPFFLGFFVAQFFGYGFGASILLGVIFISSSIAVVIPSLERSGRLSTRLGKLIVDSTVIQDIASLLLLSIIFQRTNELSNLPLYLLYPLLLLIFIGLRWIIKYAQKLFSFLSSDTHGHSHQINVVLVITIGTVVVFELLGLHPIVGGFLAGLILSDSVEKRFLKEKLSAISYGLFIPIFFVVIGAKLDLSVFQTATNLTSLIVAVLLASIIGKFIGGWLGAKFSGFSSRESSLVGSSAIPQLSTTLAVAFSGLSLGILDQELITALVILSSISTFVGPLLINFLSQKTEPA